MKKEYKITKGAPFGKEKAQVYGDRLDEISKRKNGTITPRDVVDDARNEDSIFHNYFDWDDNIAAEKYRVHQARQLINHITIIVKHDDTEKEQKAFFNVDETPDEEQSNVIYVSMERVMSEPDLRKQILQKAIKEIEYWKQKYLDYTELSKIFMTIENTKKKVLE